MQQQTEELPPKRALEEVDVDLHEAKRMKVDEEENNPAIEIARVKMQDVDMYDVEEDSKEAIDDHDKK